MTESITRISESSAVKGDGTGNARKRDKSGRPRRDGDRDCVFISDEARRRFTSEDEDDPMWRE